VGQLINPTEVGVTFGKITSSLSDPLAWLGGFSIGVITYLVQPGASFFALWVVVACDLVIQATIDFLSHPVKKLDN